MELGRLLPFRMCISRDNDALLLFTLEIPVSLPPRNRTHGVRDSAWSRVREARLLPHPIQLSASGRCIGYRMNDTNANRSEWDSGKARRLCGCGRISCHQLGHVALFSSF
ncbi:hypothetical protein J6590_071274 [Homalodisca vitripennis]|nr:hypothetical protein J6590_071274 [Homalodisca vitripennis]